MPTKKARSKRKSTKRKSKPKSRKKPAKKRTSGKRPTKTRKTARKAAPKKSSQRASKSVKKAAITKTAKSDAESRVSKRVPLRIRIDYFKDPGVFLYDYSRNLGRGGIFIETEKPFTPGTELSLSFHLPNQPTPVEVRGRVVWVHEGTTGQSMRGVPGMGIQFANPEGKYKDSLDQFFREIDYDNLTF